MNCRCLDSLRLQLEAYFPLASFPQQMFTLSRCPCVHSLWELETRRNINVVVVFQRLLTTLFQWRLHVPGVLHRPSLASFRRKFELILLASSSFSDDCFISAIYFCFVHCPLSPPVTIMSCGSVTLIPALIIIKY